MSSPSDPQHAAPTGTGQPSTKEIPVVNPAGATSAGTHLPPHPDAAPPAPTEAAQPTGPVDFVPGLPGLGTPPVPPSTSPAPPPPVPPRPVPGVPEPAPTTAAGPTWPETLDADEPARSGGERRARAPRNRSALVGLGLVVLALVLLQLGLTQDFGHESYWSSVPLWSAFATICTVLGLGVAAAGLGAGRLPAGAAWRVAAGGLVGLAVFWLLVVLPVVDSDRGFLLTMALAALGGAVWIGARTRS